MISRRLVEVWQAVAELEDGAVEGSWVRTSVVADEAGVAARVVRRCFRRGASVGVLETELRTPALVETDVRVARAVKDPVEFREFVDVDLGLAST